MSLRPFPLPPLIPRYGGRPPPIVGVAPLSTFFFKIRACPVVFLFVCELPDGPRDQIKHRPPSFLPLFHSLEGMLRLWLVVRSEEVAHFVSRLDICRMG